MLLSFRYHTALVVIPCYQTCFFPFIESNKQYSMFACVFFTTWWQLWSWQESMPICLLRMLVTDHALSQQHSQCCWVSRVHDQDQSPCCSRKARHWVVRPTCEGCPPRTGANLEKSRLLWNGGCLDRVKRNLSKWLLRCAPSQGCQTSVASHLPFLISTSNSAKFVSWVQILRQKKMFSWNV